MTTIPELAKNRFGIEVRPPFHAIYMGLAHGLALRSTCQRAHVGTVITSADYRRVLAVGYNGNAAGLPNRCDRPDEPGNCGCLHSEENAIINCDSPRQTPKIVIVTHSPCAQCAKRLINLGSVLGVIYGDEYRLTEGVDVLKKAGIYTFNARMSEQELPSSVESLLS